MNADYLHKYCIIGAGPSGLTAAKNFAARGIAFDCLERASDLGGVWNFNQPSGGVYESTHLISSKRLTEFTDFPMPKEYPPYPSHRQALDYLRAYARHFNIESQIQFQTTVQHVAPAGEHWEVTVAGEAIPRRYRGVVVANGHHRHPLPHAFPGSFAGEIMHSHDYKTPEILRNKRVLVIGGGNSGCDIAVEAAQHAAATYLSLRRGYHFLPKFLHGRPIDLAAENMHRWHWPRWLQRWVSSIMVKIALGRPERYGLPKPDHRLFETHPIVNSQLLYYVGHGRIQVKTNVERLCDNRVQFRDGSELPIDLIVLAIGYQISFPFLEENLILDAHGRPQLYLNAFHPRHDNFFVAGLIQPNSGLWGLVDRQAQLMAAFIVAQEQDAQLATWFRELKSQPNPDLADGIHFVESPRHALEVEYFSYRERLKKLLGKFGKYATEKRKTTV
ncbi:MAG TPA: NAD(P)-binding domain-containing protein [Pirellulaceae bacterium]|nr:NAD(P)-binding domain-containing protein [Pirellulaceae bacterium]